jgi:hypothetical protein
MPNYKQIREELIPNRQSFKHGHSMSAYNNGKEYLIYSYRTLIASVNLETGEVELNPNKYSVTTTKQQNLVVRALGKVGI